MKFEKAQRELADLYVSMHLTRDEGMRAARNALFQLVFGGDCGSVLPPDSPGLLLLQHAPLPQLARALDKGDDSSELLDDCSRFGGIDPLVLIAAGSYPDALDVLLAHGAKVSATNGIGKTALMEAAQFDQEQSVDWLLRHGTNPNAITHSDPPLHHDARTPLMYAAANGSLAMIRQLLAAGADPYQTDSKGCRAIDYLLGYGPTAVNPVMRREDRMKAQALLY